MQHGIVLSALIAAVLATGVTAYAGDPPAPGSRVWIETAERGRKGEVVSIDEDSVVITLDGGTTRLAVPRSAIRDMKVSLGRTKGLGRGTSALLGVFMGAGAGTLIGLTSGDDTCAGGGDYFSTCFEFTAADKAAALGILGGATGGIVGAIAGGDREKWKRVSLLNSKKVKVSLSPIGRSGLSLTLAF